VTFNDGSIVSDRVLISTHPNMDLFFEISSNMFLFLLIFGLSATVDIDALRKQLQNKFALITGVGMQFIIMPFLGYLAVILLQDHGLSPAMGITLLIVTASPGGSYSNWFCNTFNADLALSVAMTAISTILSVFFLPANLTFYSKAAYGGGGDVIDSLDFTGLFISLAIVTAGILLGLFTSYKVNNRRFKKCANTLASISGVLLILFSVLLSGSGGEEESKSLWEQHWTFFVGVSMPCILGLALANAISTIARLEKPERVTLAVECCYQNTGIATSAAISMFDGAEQAQALVVPLFYGLVEAAVLAIYCLVAWKGGWTKAPRNENLCVIITKTYEVTDDDDDDEDENTVLVKDDISEVVCNTNDDVDSKIEGKDQDDGSGGDVEVTKQMPLQ